MPLLIPTFSDSFYSEVVTLDGTEYLLDFRYNQTEDRWRLSISDLEGDPILQGVKIVCGVSLLRRTADSRKPRGVLMAQATTSDESPPGLLDLGQRGNLLYYSPDEIISA